MNESIRIALVDDHCLCRRGLTELFDHCYGFSVVGDTGKAEEVLTILNERRPDLLIMDLRMEPVDGLSILGEIRKSGCHTPVAILTMSDSESDLASAMLLGAKGYLLKDMDPEEVVSAVRRIASGELVVAPAMTMKFMNFLQNGEQEQTRKTSIELLTEREKEILQHLARGESNKVIARMLDI
ncbi:MAG TPA: response regulator transcription factor, partial [Burkholderiales bacterium]|nr:response regulator transcription factor [Burkholderiales bacterium]